MRTQQETNQEVSKACAPLHPKGNPGLPRALTTSGPSHATVPTLSGSSCKLVHTRNTSRPNHS